MITIKDFDEIVKNNPFLTNGVSAYSFSEGSMRYMICYDLEMLQFRGQSNASCKCVVIENENFNKEFKIIREDDHIHVQELLLDQDPPTRTISDLDTLEMVSRDFNTLKRITSKQIENYKIVIQEIKRAEISVEFNAIKEFLSLLVPPLKASQEQRLLRQLRKFQNEPLSLFEDATTTFNTNLDNIVNSIYLRIILSHLELSDSLIAIDWKAPFEEVMESFSPILNRLEINFDKKHFSIDNYNTAEFIIQLNKLLTENGYMSFNLGEISDAFFLAFCKKDDLKDIESLAQKINIEIRNW